MMLCQLLGKSWKLKGKTTDAKRTKWTSKDYAIKGVFPFPRQPTKRLLGGRVGSTSDVKK